MSPNEFQLRAALRDGEGDGIDADGVIGRARFQRHAHRMRLLSATAGVVIVAGIATGIGFGVHAGGSESNGGAAAAGGSVTGADQAETTAGGPQVGPRVPSEASLGASSELTGHVGILDGITCPVSPPHVQLPGGVTTAGGDGSLFPATAVAVKVCAYPVPSAPTRGSLNLDGADASALISGLNSASTLRPREGCETTLSPSEIGQLLIIPVTASGTQLTPVTVQLGCPGATATDGTAVRYGWSPPSMIATFLDRLPSVPVKDGSPAN